MEKEDIVSRHFNTHLERIDFQFWHDFIESHGKFLKLKKGDYLCRKDFRTNIVGYVKSGYLIYTVGSSGKIGGFAFLKRPQKVGRVNIIR